MIGELAGCKAGLHCRGLAKACIRKICHFKKNIRKACVYFKCGWIVHKIKKTHGSLAMWFEIIPWTYVITFDNWIALWCQAGGTGKGLRRRGWPLQTGKSGTVGVVQKVLGSPIENETYMDIFQAGFLNACVRT